MLFWVCAILLRLFYWCSKTVSGFFGRRSSLFERSIAEIFFKLTGKVKK